jgi:DNA adenine methylase
MKKSIYAGSYLGRKGGSGVAQWIINKMPKHDVYIEPFFGCGVVGFSKAAAPIDNIGYEISESLFNDLSMLEHSFKIYNHNCLNDDYLWSTIDRYIKFGQKVLVYLDPPYLPETRNDYVGSQYEHELSYDDHVLLLSNLLNLSMVPELFLMISGYKSDLYMSMLEGWHYFEFQTMSRRGKRIESLWCNFNPQSFKKHDLSYVGSSFTDRQRIQRKADRLVDKLQNLPMDERDFILSELLKRVG